MGESFDDLYVRADEIEAGDFIYGALVTQSRAYLPNPEVMWLIFTTNEEVNGSIGFIDRSRRVMRTSRRLVIQEDFGWASISRSTTSSSQT